MAQNTRRPVRRQHSDYRHVAQEARRRLLALSVRPAQPHPLHHPPQVILSDVCPHLQVMRALGRDPSLFVG